MRNSRAALAVRGVIGLLAAAGLASCGSSPTGGSDLPDIFGRPVAVVTVSPAQLDLRLGDSARLTATVKDADGRVLDVPVTWSSQKPQVATVDANGRVTAVAEGTVSITATAGGKSGSATVACWSNLPPAASIDAPPRGLEHMVGDQIGFQGSADDPEDGPLTGSALTWSSGLAGAIGQGNTFSWFAAPLGEHLITLTATDSEGGTGTDTMSIQVVCRERLLSLGETWNGRFIADDCESIIRPGSKRHHLEFDGVAGQGVTIRMSSDWVDSYLILFSPSGLLVAWNDDCPARGTNACIGWLLTETGTYTIEATTFDPGSLGGYTLELLETPFALFGVNAGDDGLSMIDPAGGQPTFIGPLDQDPDLYTTPVAMAVGPFDGQIYVWNNSSASQATGELLSVDVCTGLATRADPATPVQGPLGAIAYMKDEYGGEYLYGVNDDLYLIDDQGYLDWVGSLGNQMRVGALDFAPDGTLYGVTVSGSVATTGELVKIDQDTGAATVVGLLSPVVGTIGSIVFDPSGVLIGSAFGGPDGDVLFDIDPATGAVSNIRNVTGGAVPQGMGFAPSCPP